MSNEAFRDVSVEPPSPEVVRHFRVGDVRFHVYPFESGQDHLGYQEEEGTNETMTGIAKRATFAKANHRDIESFVGIGHPAKALIQAAVLHPTQRLGVIDLSAQNTFDAVLMLNALKAGYQNTIEYVTTDPQGRDLYVALASNVESIIQGRSAQAKRIRTLGERVDTSLTHIKAADAVLQQLIRKMQEEGVAIDIQSVTKAVQEVKDIDVFWGSVRNREIIGNVTASRMATAIVDLSNIPVYNIPPLNNPVIFSATTQHPVYFEDKSQLHEYPYPTDKQYPNANIIWDLAGDYPSGTTRIFNPKGGLAVTLSPNLHVYYGSLARRIGFSNNTSW